AGSSGRQDEARLQLPRRDFTDTEEPGRTVDRDATYRPGSFRLDPPPLPDPSGRRRIDGDGRQPREHSLRRQEQRVETVEPSLARDRLELGLRMHVGRREWPDADAAQRLDVAERAERRRDVADERPHVRALRATDRE